ncbi:MAG: chaperone NapD [Desulfuromonadales bacterium]|nr:chaperone NapD [Desulfuromonadales bacterium]NIS44161.1 chaperone NapD [Desulfuromonadales bacterium]
MPIASAVVVPVEREDGESIAERLRELPGLEVSGVGDKGVAVVLEGDSIETMKEISEEIADWDEVLEFQLAYLNWEDLENV